ncbi:glutathione S-transferase family protein [Glaciecola sp. 33A]|jgi:glutathione S-transferase|uniref:glutathione S-transferase family protein n=1 Tax=Glaciecola sp. 33A TaxID=2057807 RepID=UPI000C33B3BF|nr:glutathione S-transferase [Glaciecola sp. 33A]PKI02579.1 glutathione S-transferase [Glaciecola sp. 33A]
MFQLHHLNNSRSQRIVWMLESVGADYEIKIYRRDATTNLAPPELKKIHPLGRAPVLIHDGKVIAESGAICDYIARQFPDSGMLPDESAHSFNDVQFWSHYAEGSFMPSLVTSMVLEKAREKVSPFFVRYVADKIIDGVMDAYFGKNIEANLVFVEGHLADNKWFVGDIPTLADVQMSFGLEGLFDSGKLKPFKHMTTYVQQLRNLQSHRTATAKMKEAEASF